MSNYKSPYNVSKYETIKENTVIYVVNGHWTAEIVKDVYTDKLVLYVPVTKKVTQINQKATYDDLFPNDDIRVYVKYKDQYHQPKWHFTKK